MVSQSQVVLYGNQKRRVDSLARRLADEGDPVVSSEDEEGDERPEGQDGEHVEERVQADERTEQDKLDRQKRSEMISQAGRRT